MIRLTKYLKPYVLLILLAIGLLFVQANADLALPDYLSRIVNTGIQQSGIENAVPSAIRSSRMDHLVLFLTPEEKDRVLSDYTLVDSSSPDYEETLKTIPGLEKEPVYLLSNTDPVEIAWLDPVMAKGLLAVSAIDQAIADPAKAAQMGAAAGFDLSKLPPGTDLYSMVEKMSPAQREQIGSKLQEQFSAMGEKAVQQAAVQVVKNEYVALGMDTAGCKPNTSSIPV